MISLLKLKLKKIIKFHKNIYENMKIHFDTRKVETIEEYAKGLVIPGEYLNDISISFPHRFEQRHVNVVLSFSKNQKPLTTYKVQKFIEVSFKSFEEVETDEDQDFVNGVTHLTCPTTLRDLKGIPKSVMHLRCSFNKNLTFSDIPQHITSLNCCFCNIKNWDNIKLPKMLRSFSCGSNSVTKLPDSLTDNLEELTCCVTQIEDFELHRFPKLTYLQCSNTKIRNFKGLSKNIKTVLCSRLKHTLESFEGLPLELWGIKIEFTDWNKINFNELRHEEFNRKCVYADMPTTKYMPKRNYYDKVMEKYNEKMYSIGGEMFNEIKQNISNLCLDGADNTFDDEHC